MSELSTLPPSQSARDTARIESDYFDRFVADAKDFNPFMDRGWQTLARAFHELVRPHPEARLLDIGCGTGQSWRVYQGKVKEYVGVDLSQGALEAARRNYPDLRWVRSDACQLPFADSSFDIVAYSSVLHHIPEYRYALIEGLRVLRPGGVAFAYDPNLLHPAMAIFRAPRSPLYLKEGVSPNERPLLPRWLRTAFKSSGFVNLRQRGQADIPFRYVAPRLLNGLLRVYNISDRLLATIGLGRYFGSFVITVGYKPQ